jgi:hypothetical protein
VGGQRLAAEVDRLQANAAVAARRLRLSADPIGGLA